jgi:hypothetical protein
MLEAMLPPKRRFDFQWIKQCYITFYLFIKRCCHSSFYSMPSNDTLIVNELKRMQKWPNLRESPAIFLRLRSNMKTLRQDSCFPRPRFEPGCAQLRVQGLMARAMSHLCMGHLGPEQTVSCSPLPDRCG